MHSPEFYTRHLSIICEDIRCDLFNLLNTKFDGHYIRREGDKYIKQANIMGTPIVYELKTGDNGKILYKSGMWSGNFLISAQTDYYELFDDGVLEVYKALYSIAFSEENN
jgi:hypothetical protein